MATVLNYLPQVRRNEIDLSDNLVARIGNTVGTVIRSYKGPIKRPVVVTNSKDYVTMFGAPVFTSGSDTKIAGGKKIVVPDFGYGAYSVLNVLEETASVIVIRGFDEQGGDKYSNVVADFSSFAEPYAVSADSAASSGIGATAYVEGDPFDTDTFISSVDLSASVFIDTIPNMLLVTHNAPSTFGNDLAVTVELASSACDWLYTYDGYPIIHDGVDLADIWNNATSAAKYFPIASNMIKVSVFTKPTGKTWDDMYVSSDDRTAGKLRVLPVESFYGTLMDQLDTERNSLFIEDVINANSNFIYMKTTKKADASTPKFVMSSATYTAPYGIDSTGSFYVYKNAIMALGGGSVVVESGLSEDLNVWDIFKNRREVTVDILLNPSWIKASKQKTAQIVASRMDCFAELQSNPPDAYTVADILENETYGYPAPSYVGLAVGFSRVYDQYNSKDVWLPNAIFAAVVDLRTSRLTKPWVAPAGTNRGILAVDEQLKRYSDPEMDQLEGRNLNPVSFENGYGFVIWGQRTAQLKRSALDRKNVRFNLLYIENNIEQSLKQFIFENNTQQTRMRMFDLVDTFLGGVKAGGGLYDYQVVCDETNNPPSIIDTNQLNIDIYVKPTKTAEIINFTTVVVKTGASFNTVRLQYV